MCLSLSVQVESSEGDPEKESGQESEPPALTVSWCGGVCSGRSRQGSQGAMDLGFRPKDFCALHMLLFYMDPPFCEFWICHCVCL